MRIARPIRRNKRICEPVQPFPRGFEIGGILNGLTTFQLTFARVDQTLLNTQGLPGSTAGIGFANTYFAPVVPAQGGFVQTGARAGGRYVRRERRAARKRLSE